MIEELHRPLKSAIKCHATERWTEVLSIILLGLRASLKEDILCTPAELVFGTTIRLPGEMFDSSKPDDDVVNFVSKFKSHMQSLHPKPPKHHGKRPDFIHPGLLEATHVFLRRDMLRRPLQQPYDGPFKVLQRKDKVFFLDINGKRVSVSIDRCKPAFFFNTEDLQLPQTKNETPATVEPNATASTPATVESDPTASTPTQPSTRSGRKVHLPTRCFPALPVAVDATFALVRAVIQDMLFEVEKTFCLEGDIQMLYSVALIRFVNVIVEQHKNVKFGRGASYLGIEQNIPSWIIDLRHEASHSFCPSLQHLRMAAERSLQYLEDTFWKPESANVRSIINVTNEQEEEVYILIKNYKNLQFQKLENDNISELNNDMKPILNRIYDFIENHWRIFINILVQPDIFTASEDIQQLLIMSSDTLYLEDLELTPLPLALEEFWMPILVLIHQKDKIPHFLENLLIAQENCVIPICQKTAIAWAVQIILGPSSTSPLGTCFQKKGLLLDFRKLFYACLKSTNKYSYDLCQIIMEELGDTKKYSHLFAIMALKNGECVPKEHNSQQSTLTNEIVFTIEDVLEDLNEIKRKEKPNTCNDNIWSVAPAVDGLGTYLFCDVDVTFRGRPLFRSGATGEVFMSLTGVKAEVW
ncbi:ribosomal biogenesis protein LAS1L [Trichonephila clavipes]|nr:ribosomal biogenesis protein LAS1L [Trichonephila clavipes]